MNPWRDCSFDDIKTPTLKHLYDDESRWAIKAALGARRPLLLRGEPGVGKSQLAAAAAYSLRRPLVTQVVTSRTEAEELLYHFDAVARLARAQVLAFRAGSASPKPAPSIEGEAPAAPGADEGSNGEHLCADARHDRVEARYQRLEAEVEKDPLHELRFLRPGALWWVFDWRDAERQYAALSDVQGPRPAPPPEEWNWQPEQGTVLLIDELDKAEPDVPNALLESFGEVAFGVPYRGWRVVAPKAAAPPLVIVTTNEERELPPAFLRRCLVHELKLLEGEKLVPTLVGRGKAHFDGSLDEEVLLQVAELLVKERGNQRDAPARPGQAEYLDILRALDAIHPGDTSAQLGALDRIGKYSLSKNSGQGA